MKAQRTNIVAAGVLALLTITLFAVSRNSGPESSIRQFHEAIARRDSARLARVSSPPRTIKGSQVAILIEQLIRQGAQVRFGSVEKKPPDSVVEVAYLLRDGRTWALRMFLTRVNGVWKIDLDETASVSSPNSNQRTQV